MPRGSFYTKGGVYANTQVVPASLTPEIELQNNDGAFLLNNDGVQLIDNT